MVISWLAAFADVPEPRVRAALEFWAAVTASTPREAAGREDEYLPLAGDGEDPYLWIQRVQRPAGDGGWHPDLYVAAPEIEAHRASELGARIVREVPGLRRGPGRRALDHAAGSGRAALLRHRPRPVARLTLAE